jgi:hypothetical protein
MVIYNIGIYNSDSVSEAVESPSPTIPESAIVTLALVAPDPDPYPSIFLTRS